MYSKSSAIEQSSVTAHTLLDTQQPQRAPQRGGLARHHRLAEVALQPRDDAGRRQAGATDQNSLGVYYIGRDTESVGALLGLLVDVAHALEPAMGDDLEPGRRPVRAPGAGDDLGVRRGERDAAGAEVTQRLGD